MVEIDIEGFANVLTKYHVRPESFDDEEFHFPLFASHIMEYEHPQRRVGGISVCYEDLVPTLLRRSFRSLRDGTDINEFYHSVAEARARFAEPFPDSYPDNCHLCYLIFFSMS